MKIDSKNPRHWLLLLQQWLHTMLAIAARPFRRKPAKPLVILYGHQLAGNLKALYGEWLMHYQADMDLWFLSLDPGYSSRLERDGISVLRCNRAGDMLKLSQASAMITDHGLHLMTPLLRFTDIVFIDVWHGIPFKGFVPEDFSLQHRYDEVWVSSPLLKKMYEEQFGFDSAKVVSIGYARADKLFNRKEPDPALKDILNNTRGQKIVLYAPTWQQDDEGRDLFPFGEDKDHFVSVLNDTCAAHGAILVIRSHLNARINPLESANIIYCSQSDYPDTEELLLATDVLICDWSSIAFDYLALNMPTLFLDVKSPFRNGFSLTPDYRFGKVVASMVSLREALHYCLEDPNTYLSEQYPVHQRITADVYGGNTDGMVAKRQMEHLLELTTRHAG